MISTGDTLTVIFGMVASITAVGAIWVAYKQYTTTTTTRPEPDVELGILNPTNSNSSANIAMGDENDNAIIVGRYPQEGSQVHHVVGDILELLSRHLRPL